MSYQIIPNQMASIAFILTGKFRYNATINRIKLKQNSVWKYCEHVHVLEPRNQKTGFSLIRNKGADQLRSISPFVFATRIDNPPSSS